MIRSRPLVGTLLLALLFAVLAPAAPARADLTSDAAACLASGKVWVVVQSPSGTQGGCASDFSDGLTALKSAGFTVNDMGGGFVCQINQQPAECSWEPLWWSYWHRTPAGSGWADWEFSGDMASAYEPQPGTVEGWSLVPVSGTLTPPAFTPPKVTPPSTPTPTPGEVVDIPDDNFRACLNKTLRQPKSSAITATQLASIKTLECTYAGIHDLTGAQHLVNATSIKLDLNKITDASPLNGLPKLATLGLDGNDLASMAGLTSLPALTALDLSGNELTDVAPLAKLTTLTELDLGSQKVAKQPVLTSIAPLAALTRLTSLDVSGNAITTIEPVAGLQELQLLRLYNNQVTTLEPVRQLTKLAELNAHSNQISDLTPLTVLPALRQVNLRYNQITTIAPLRRVETLKVVDLGENTGITDHASLAGLPALEDLGLSRTGLVDTSFLTTLPKLHKFIAHDNAIADLSGMAGRSWTSWGVLKQRPTLTVRVNELVDLGLRDQTGAVINPSPLDVADVSVAIPMGEGRMIFTTPGTHTVRFKESTSGARFAKFDGVLTVTVLAADEPTPEPTPSEDPTPELTPEPTPSADPTPSEDPSSTPSDPTPSEPSAEEPGVPTPTSATTTPAPKATPSERPTKLPHTGC